MSTAKHIGRVGALAVALGTGATRRSATRVALSIGVAAVVATSALAPVSTESPTVDLSADSTALLLCGTACPTWNDAHVEMIENQFIAPTQTDPDIDYVAVTAPMELWPITGLFRVLGLLGFGEPGCARPGGDCWPDYPLWKLSGLFDLTVDQSIDEGVARLEEAMAKGGDDHLVIYGDNQGAIVANAVKRKLAEQYPAGEAPDIDFVLTSDFNVPNGGIHARFPGLYIPILDWTFDGPEPTDTEFDTDVIIRQYDGFADFPLYPLNVVATLNALLGVIYVSPFLFDVSLQPDPTAKPPTVTTQGNTTYHFFETDDLPLFAPLRMLGVPEPLIDVVEPFFRGMVELGYDRTIPPGQPTPARLIPPLDAVFGSPSMSSDSAPVAVTMAEPANALATEVEKAADQSNSTEVTRQMSTDTATQTHDVTNIAGAEPKNTITADATTSEPAKPRPLARLSQKMGERVRALLTGANRGLSTTRTAAEDVDRSARGGPFSAARSPVESSTSTDGDSSDENSSHSGGDPD